MKHIYIKYTFSVAGSDLVTRLANVFQQGRFELQLKIFDLETLEVEREIQNTSRLFIVLVKYIENRIFALKIFEICMDQSLFIISNTNIIIIIH